MSSLCEMLRILFVFVKKIEAITRCFTLQSRYRSPRQVVIDLLVQQRHWRVQRRDRDPIACSAVLREAPKMMYLNRQLVVKGGMCGAMG